MICPGCSTPLGGLATWCHVCEAYTVDMVDQVEAASATGQGRAEIPHAEPVPDTRSEEEIRLAIRAALELLGFVVLDFEQGYRRDGSTRVRKGLADLYVMGLGVGVWRELKSATGRLTPDQEIFGEDCRRSGISWDVWRHESEAIAWAEEVRAQAARRTA